MIPEITEQELHRGMAVTRILWFAIFVSILLCASAAPALADKVTFSLADQGYRILRLAIYGGGLVALILSWVIPRNLLKNPRPITPSKSGSHPAISRYVAAMTLALAMSQWIGILGLILYLLGRQRQDLYLLTLLSVAAMLLCFPKREEILKVSQAISNPGL